MPTAIFDGVSLYYEEKGTGEPVVFIHGIPTDFRAWTQQIGEFLKNYRTITYSRRYASPNERKGDLMDSTVQNNAEDLKNLLENLGAAPAHLVGHSYGGFVAVYLAAQSPQLIRSLVLVEPAVSTMLVEDPDSNAQMLGLLLRSPSIALAARRFQSSSLRPSLKALDAGDMQAVARLNVDGVMGRDGAFDTLPDWAKSMAVDNARTVGELRTRFPPFKDRARKVTCDTLVINGELSPPWSRRIGRLLVRALPRAEGATIMGSSHFPHIEKPDQFNKIVLDFLERHKAAAVGPAIPEQVQRPIGVP